MKRLPTPRIAYLPWFDQPAEKGYTFLMRRALADFADVVRYEGIVATWRSGCRLDALVVNWTDNDLVDRQTRRIALRKVAKVFARAMVLRLAARRLVFVRHNVYSHAVAPGAEAAAERWVDRYERLFDVVLTHSGDESQRRRRYCPHPLYERVDGPHTARSGRALPDPYWVAFGRIVPYKRLEALMRAFPADRTLVVMGAVGDKKYAASLAAVAGPNVVFAPGLVDEGEAQAIVAGAEALLIAHAERDVVVSSSFFFAMSLGTPVRAVATPFLRWIAPRVGEAALVVADDVERLCAGIDASPSNARPDTAAIEREFGDATVRAALGAALGMASRPPSRDG